MRCGCSLYAVKLVLALNPSFSFRIWGLGVGISPSRERFQCLIPLLFPGMPGAWGIPLIGALCLCYIYKQQTILTIIASHNIIWHYYCMLGMIVAAEKLLHTAVHLIVGTSCTVTSPLSPLIFFLMASSLYFVINCTVPLLRHSTLMVQVSKGSCTQKEREREKHMEVLQQG